MTRQEGAVSVVMAVYNGERFLMTQIRSVLAELRPQDELVIVDDASTDGSSALLSSIDDARVVLSRQERNQGVLQTFERGLRHSKHGIVFLCDQDDVWLPGKRLAIVEGFEGDETLVAVVSDAQIIDADGAVIGMSFMASRGGFKGGFWSTVYRNRYLGCAMAVRRQVIDAALPIPRYVPMHDMWIGALASLLGSVKYVPEPLIQYRRHCHNASPASRQSLGRILKWRFSLLYAVAVRLLELNAGTRSRS